MRMSDADGMMILVAGPYRSGTGDDPSRLKMFTSLGEIPGCSRSKA
jgi:hypothetical protein